MSPRKDDDDLGNKKDEKARTKTTTCSLSPQQLQLNCMAVMGIYKKGKAPRAHKDLPPEQIMVRQRLHTRPLDGGSDAGADAESNGKIVSKNNDNGEEQDNYDVAMFQPIQGLVVHDDDDEAAPLYHRDIDRHSDSDNDEKRASFFVC